MSHTTAPHTYPVRNILVHLDHGHRAPVRLALAVDLARRHGARLLGLFAEHGKPHSVGVVSVWPGDAYRAASAASRDAFATATAGLADAEWRDANRGGAAEVIQCVTEAAHHVDLAILGQEADDGSSLVPPGMVEQVIQHAGRPVLVVPYAGPVALPFRRPLIAWNHSRESARALNDALPLMAGGEGATLAVFSRHPEDEQASTADCVRHLSCHGIPATVEILAADGIGMMDMLLNRAADEGADLLVMGAHAAAGGFPGLHRGGGGTRHILGHMTVPVLMSC